jgi:hypothetical protein
VVKVAPQCFNAVLQTPSNHDLIDLQLMEELIEDYSRLKTACIEIFDLRRTHPWPPTLSAEPTRRDTYRELATELDFPTKDIAEAVAFRGRSTGSNSPSC